jgi:hypothetical protein
VGSASLDLSDAAAFARWLEGLRSAFADADAVALDLLRPPRSRELGPALAARSYAEARTAVLASLDVDLVDDHGDPAGRGGAGPEE